MSTQKRVNRSQQTRCTDRMGAGCIPLPGPIARYVCAAAKGRTAPMMSILWSALVWVATKFLHSDYHIRQLGQPLLKADRRGSPPPRVACRAPLGRQTALGKQASPRSSIPHISYPSGSERLHRILPHGPIGPQAPAGSNRRAERYDGKRDLYFQHAA
jgi:hypothetical protein